MSEKEFNEIFSQRLRHYLSINDMSQAELAKKLGVGTTSVSNWVNGAKTPRMDKVDQMCSIFGIRRIDLMETKDEEDEYYLNPETAQIAQKVYDDPDLRMLFDAARDVKPEAIRKAAEMLRLFKETNR